jgi:nucleoside-diphosphate-sugar epimerase
LVADVAQPRRRFGERRCEEQIEAVLGPPRDDASRPRVHVGDRAHVRAAVVAAAAFVVEPGERFDVGGGDRPTRDLADLVEVGAQARHHHCGELVHEAVFGERRGPGVDDGVPE